jgi:rare lipoprotein A
MMRKIILLLTIAMSAAPAEGKAPGKTYCHNGVCHRVLTVAETLSQVGKRESVRASFYDDCKVDPGNPCKKLSSGEEMRGDDAGHAASPVYPNGTILMLSNPSTGTTLRVRINNSGPYVKGRQLDVSAAGAKELGFTQQGVATLEATVIAAPADIGLQAKD